ncbi:Flavin-dependent oxidoreductase [Carbonactinospora thermoautotrophica]|uniref:Flavin-dependent oxidoreductase n=1 Tax=Carbonactinospora thermoautotrophica TaxID=1469144 RepID=A0A132MUJ7_9ACTN|nr:LLM class flavin-dependent oxidoreductase [Carbonactinospora thermoautotrophica]KWX01509.1 Flavin-dependent oxidoreductase [Carbonactinospora thermoautotrophica]
MKITLFEQAPYRYLPPDFEQRYESVCSTPYFPLVTSDGVYSSIRDFMDELMLGARAGFDGVAVTEHGQSSYDMMPNPDLVASALAYATETEGLEVAIFPMGRSLGKSREPVRVAEEYALIDVMSGGRLVAGFPVGLSYDANLNNGVPPMQTRPRFDENLELVLRAWSEREPFAWNGRYSQYPQVNIWPRTIQQPTPPVWITGIGNPRTMRMCLERGFGFNYLSWFGAKLTGKRIFDRFWELADQVGVPRNPYRLGFLQTIAVAETDERAEREYAEHLEYGFRKGLGSIPPEKLGLPGAIDIRGVQALLKDPGDFGLYYQMRNASFRELVDAGVVIVGSPATVREQIRQFCRDYGIGNLHAMLGFGSLPRDLAMKNIHLFAEEVAPHLRGLWADTGFQHHWWPERLGGVPLLASEGAAEEQPAWEEATVR